MIDLVNLKYEYFNERDLEKPGILLSTISHLKDIDSFLDVGAHYSHATYAKELRQILKNKCYDALDILPDEPTELLVDNYFVSNITDFSGYKYDYVSCISAIEHAGLTTYKKDNFIEEQRQMFSSLVRIAKKYIFITFPFGAEGLCVGEYANITDTQLVCFENMMPNSKSNVHFYCNEFPQGKKQWNEISRGEASSIPLCIDKGVQCVCLAEFSF